ncbi:hypothetical protein [Antrihabitans cavernicola]|uniref:Di-and tripeptidase n=1 Tax=Antrihabitans cavernicola TaxID=2495913 RepID=A0A5A7SE81_9NOCA|nr:hypothetical protein [Spelaeibacter cavernicola]KAA0022531.1 hypothetical protein FOY51_12585 [Spelaeibacter cavernicola]
MADRQGRLEKTVVSLLDNGSKLQGPAVAKYVERARRAHPDDSPAQIIERLEKTFLNAVTGSGGAVGAAAAVPGVGTVASIAAAGAETVFFLEASAVLTLAVASVHGIEPSDNEQRKALVLAVALGDSGREIVERTLGRSAKHYGTALGTRVTGMQGMNNSLLKRFITRYAAKRGALAFGKVIPAGIGAVIGGVGNRALGKGVINNARDAFGPPPPRWPATEVIIDADPSPTAESLPAVER